MMLHKKLHMVQSLLRIVFDKVDGFPSSVCNCCHDVFNDVYEPP